MKEHVISALRESADVKMQMAKESLDDIVQVSEVITRALKAGKKILIFGNGGSAADSQHIAAEFVNRFMTERKALAALALTTDSSIITSIANDASFNDIFSRQIEAVGNKGDIALGITTSGKSANVLKALEIAKQKELKTLAFSGNSTTKLKKHTDLIITVPSTSTQRIQEAHITVAHIICELIENALTESGSSGK
ncbi:MAG: D-sedoheptulose 7-phosphate isomerase [Candidatus Dadabacteria bacterium]|nr:D-sedoheptulose 7-phosphate isomerase [Candidatus Dadabacteria bacterium]NIV42935.1 SIS domain-containing protein [Candidatus Dadabacteria bacterium]NIX15994.1 SIS domain-containing protein [Candidatus Dadabacteria bacterium]